MIEINAIVDYGKKYADEPMTPLTVIAHLRNGAPVTQYGTEAIHLDGVLSKAVIYAALHCVTLPDSDDPYWLPLPLQVLWQHPDGRPLWAASGFYPVGDYVQENVYIHKRNPSMHFSNNAKIETGKGRYMERRVPIPALIAESWEARCIGARIWIENLLELIDNIGKHRNRGFGAVARWEIREAQWSPADIYSDGARLLRSLPAEANLIPWPGRPVNIGWTPPQWKPSLFSAGWPVGTPVTLDWSSV